MFKSVKKNLKITLRLFIKNPIYNFTELYNFYKQYFLFKESISSNENLNLTFFSCLFD